MPKKLSERCQVFRAKALKATVKPETHRGYAAKVREIGDPTYEGFLEFARKRTEEPGQKLAASTLRTYKSALVHIRKVAGYPMSQEENDDLDEVITGIQCSEQPRAKRGPVDEDKLADLVAAAHASGEHDIGFGMVVMYGITCRPRDLGEMIPARVDLKENTVWVRRKASARMIAKDGVWEAHPITTEGAKIILAKQIKKTSSSKGLLFPGWRAAKARNIVHQVAKAKGWDPKLVWDGTHGLRHGAAHDILREALEQVRTAGGWKTKGSAAHYSRLGRQGPPQ